MGRCATWDRLVEGQHGAFSLAQAAAHGRDRSHLRREVKTGRIRRGLPGVYLLAGSPRTYLQRAHEVRLWAGGSSALSFTTASSLLGLDVRGDGCIHVTTPRNLRPPNPSVRVHRHKLSAADICDVRGLKTTTMPRTVIDLASVLPEEALDLALDSAIRAGMWRSTFLGRFFAAAPERPPGVALLRRIVEEREAEQGLTGSAFERRLLRLLRAHGFPMPVCQHPVRNRSITAFIDFAYPEFGIAIEADGYRWHDGRSAFEKDRLRCSELASWGWRVIQVTWLQLKYDPVGVLKRIRRALDTPAVTALRSS